MAATKGKRTETQYYQPPTALTSCPAPLSKTSSRPTRRASSIQKIDFRLMRLRPERQETSRKWDASAKARLSGGKGSYTRLFQLVNETGRKRGIWRKAQDRKDARGIIKQVLRDLDDCGAAAVDARNMTPHHV